MIRTRIHTESALLSSSQTSKQSRAATQPDSYFFSKKKNFQPLSFSSSYSMLSTKQSGRVTAMDDREGTLKKHVINFHDVDEKLIQKMVHDALVWCSLHGLVVGDRSSQRSGELPGVGMVHAPFSLLPMPFPESYWKLACEMAPIFNELVDRVSLDGKFLQCSLSRANKVDGFTSRLLDIHSKMLENNKKEDIRLGLHRSDYMLDEQTKLLLQIELNTISSSFPGLSCLTSELHRHLLNNYGNFFGLHSNGIPENSAVSQFAAVLHKAWMEYDNTKAVIMVVVQSKEHNMYDQYWLCVLLKERYNVLTIRKTLAEVDGEGEILPDGTLFVDGDIIAVVYFRAGYGPNDYPSEAEWRARLLIEQSSAVKCPSISYHLVGTKKIQQELSKLDVLERFVQNKKDIQNLHRCFAGLWSLDDLDAVRAAIEKPNLFVMKPQREGGGNNIYNMDVRDNLLRLEREGTREDAAYILMQRIFPAVCPTFLVRNGVCSKDLAISELGVYSAYLRYAVSAFDREKPL